jgi:hypothetical protein
MRRIRVHKPKAGRRRPRAEVLPLDPRDPDVLRAKRLQRAQAIASHTRAA